MCIVWILLSHILEKTLIGKLFYSFILKQHMCKRLVGHSNLVTRVNSICDMYGISMLRYICNDGYANKCKTGIKGFVKCDGIIDSTSYLLHNFSNENREVLKLLL